MPFSWCTSAWFAGCSFAMGAAAHPAQVPHVHLSLRPGRDPVHQLALLQRPVLQADRQPIVLLVPRRDPQEVARGPALERRRAGDREAGGPARRSSDRERLVQLSRERLLELTNRVESHGASPWSPSYRNHSTLAA